MEVTVHSVFYNKDGTRLDSTQPQTMYPDHAAWHGDVFLEDLPAGLQIDRERFGVRNGIIPNSTIKLISRSNGEYALILEQQVGHPGESYYFTRSMDIGGEGSPEDQRISDAIAREGIRLRRTVPDGGKHDIFVFAETPRQKNMALLNQENTDRLRARFASKR